MNKFDTTRYFDIRLLPEADRLAAMIIFWKQWRA